MQLEWLESGGGWVWIVRYDTAGGRPHRDCNRIAAHEAVTLPTDAGKAAREAAEDLKANANAYTEAYQAAKAAKESW